MATTTNPTVPGDDDPTVRDLDNLECEGRRVLLRTSVWTVDYALRRLARMQAGAAPEQSGPQSTLERLIEDGARVVVATHLDAQACQQLGYADMISLGEAIAGGLRAEVLMPDDCVGEAAESVAQDLRPGQLCLLPDLSAHPGEAAGEERFAHDLERLCDVYVADGLDLMLESWASTVRLPLRVRDAGLGRAALASLSQLVTLAQTAMGARFAIIGDAGPLEEQLPQVEALLSAVPRVICIGNLGKALCYQSRAVDIPPRVRSVQQRAEALGVQLITPPADAELTGLAGELEQAVRETSRGGRAGLWWGTAGKPADKQVLDALASGPALVTALGAELHNRLAQLDAPELAFRSCAEPAVALAVVTKRKLPGIEALVQAQLRQRASAPRGAPGIDSAEG